MTPEQLLYADTDVLYLGKLLEALMGPIKKWGLVKCFNLENQDLLEILLSTEYMWILTFWMRILFL
jgi:ribonuclease D